MLTKFIAEVSSNHQQNLDRCLRFIEEAARIGCDAVKFQLFRVEDLFAPEVLRARPAVLERKRWELPTEFLPVLAERSRTCGIQFATTPFSLRAVETLQPFVDFYKIASYELLWGDLLKACAATGKPVVLSTGMADMNEIARAVDTLRNAGCTELALPHCTSAYPTPPQECNLAAIGTMPPGMESRRRSSSFPKPGKASSSCPEGGWWRAASHGCPGSGGWREIANGLSVHLQGSL